MFTQVRLNLKHIGAILFALVFLVGGLVVSTASAATVNVANVIATDNNTNFGSPGNAAINVATNKTLDQLFSGSGLKYTYTILNGDGTAPAIAVINLTDGRHVVLFPGYGARTGTYTLTFNDTTATDTKVSGTGTLPIDFVIYPADYSSKTWSSNTVQYGNWAQIKASTSGLTGSEAVTDVSIQTQGANTGESDRINLLDINGDIHYGTIQDAVSAANDGDTINIAAGTYNLDSQIRIAKPLTIIGAGDSTIITVGTTTWVNTAGSKGYSSLITVAGVSGAVRLEGLKLTGAKSIPVTPCIGTEYRCTDYGHGLNIVGSSNVTLKNITSTDNAGAGLIVNSSNVSAENLNTSGNVWYGVNVDKTGASLTLTGSGTIAENKQIFSDNPGFPVIANGYVSYIASNGIWWSNKPILNVATITRGETRMLYEKIQDAVKAANPGETINIAPGNYNITKDDVNSVAGQTGWFLPINKDNITLQGVDANGQPITSASNVATNIYSTQETPNGIWSSQSLIAVFGNNVTIRGLGIMNKIEPNKGIEVMGNNFTAEYNRFSPVPVELFANANNYGGDDITKYGSGVYFNNNGATEARTGTVINNIFKNSGVTFDSFKNNWTVNVTHNIFDGNRIWHTEPSSRTLKVN